LSGLVLDASVVGALSLEDEWTPSVPLVLDRLLGETLAVPAHWYAEIASILAIAARRGRITLARRDHLLEAARAFRPEVEPADRTDWRTVAELADRERLSIYDAAYLDLALRRSMTLATNDQALLEAAKRRGVPVVTTRA
jgi:predicted nucleic acid-binding protein